MATLLFGPSYATVGGITLGGREDSGVEFLLEDIVGMGVPGGTLAPAPRPRQRGATAGDSFSKPRPLVIKGFTYAPTQALALDALSRLTQAFPLAETQLTIVQSGVSLWCPVRRDGDLIPTWMGPTAFSWSVQLVDLDSRMFGLALTGSTGLPVASGGFVVPETWPLVIAGGGSSGSVSLVNTGTETGPVVIRIDGPCPAFAISHQSPLGLSTFASSLVLNVGEFVLIDMEAKTMMANGQASRSLFITSRAWTSFYPGPNSWSFTAASYNAASLMTVTATPAN